MTERTQEKIGMTRESDKLPFFKNASFFSPRSGVRLLFDLLWIIGFLITLFFLLFASETKRGFNGKVNLNIESYRQKRSILFKGQEVGYITTEVKKETNEYEIKHRLYLLGQKENLIRVKIQLRSDLSLKNIFLVADPDHLGRFSLLAKPLLASLNVGKSRLSVHCRIETAKCNVSGHVGKRRIDENFMVGRGPVIPEALLPLLARGTLGKRAELVVFDPLSLSRKVILYERTKEETISIKGKDYLSLKIKQGVEGLQSHLWIDDRGRILKEEIAMGIEIVHSAWEF